MTFLSNQILRIRALEPTDLEFLYACENDTENWSTGNTHMPLSRYVLRAYLQQDTTDVFAATQFKWAITLTDGRLVGLLDVIGIDHYHQRAEVGIFIEKSYRKNGYAAQALGLFADYAKHYLGWHQLTAIVAEKNTASHRLFQKVGFVQSGVWKDFLKTPTGYENALLYQLVL